jgi:hypothetical protein
VWPRSTAAFKLAAIFSLSSSFRISLAVLFDQHPRAATPAIFSGSGVQAINFTFNPTPMNQFRYILLA